MSAFTTLEFDVMDETYFIIPFSQLVQNTRAAEEEVKAAVLNLLSRGFIQQLIYNTTLQDFEKMDNYREAELKTASYVATKKGLLAHNTNN